LPDLSSPDLPLCGLFSASTHTAMQIEKAP
jgi:hypothetical protein